MAEPSTIFKRLDPAKLRPHPKSISIYGDQPCQELIDSVAARGVMEALVLAADEKTVLSGRRRRQAAIAARLPTVPCTIRLDLTDSLDMREAVLDANIRNERTNEQRAREFQERKEIEEARALLRRKATQFGRVAGGGSTPAPQPAPSERGEAAEIAAHSVGWSVPTAEQATDVLLAVHKAKQAGREEEAERLVEVLNDESVSAAHRLVVSRKKPAAPRPSRAYTADRLTKCKAGLEAMVRHMPPGVYKEVKGYVKIIRTKLDGFSLND